MKKVTGYVKLQLPAGKANPSPPVGPALGQHGVNIMGFCKEFNAKTAGQGDMIIPVVITIFSDRSFTFITKTPPTAVLLKKAAGPGDGEEARQRLERAQPQQGGQGLEQAAARAGRAEDEGHEHDRRRSCDQHAARHGAFDGD